MTYNIFLSSGTAPWEISINTRVNDSQAIGFLTPQLLLDTSDVDPDSFRSVDQDPDTEV